MSFLERLWCCEDFSSAQTMLIMHKELLDFEELLHNNESLLYSFIFGIDEYQGVYSQDMLKNPYNVRVINFFFNNGIGVNTQNLVGQTLLMEAFARKDAELVGFLLDRGACYDFVDAKGQTLMMRAFKLANPKLVKLLLDHKANLDVTDGRGNKAQDYFVKEENIDKFIDAVNGLEGSRVDDRIIVRSPNPIIPVERDSCCVIS